MNWNQRVQRAKAAKRFTEEDQRLASLWVTDPVSEHKVAFRDGRVELGPIDIYLVLDGIFFTKGVEEQDVKLALACYESIQKRIRRLNG